MIVDKRQKIPPTLMKVSFTHDNMNVLIPTQVNDQIRLGNTLVMHEEKSVMICHV